MFSLSFFFFAVPVACGSSQFRDWTQARAVTMLDGSLTQWATRELCHFFFKFEEKKFGMNSLISAWILSMFSLYSSNLILDIFFWNAAKGSSFLSIISSSMINPFVLHINIFFSLVILSLDYTWITSFLSVLDSSFKNNNHLYVGSLLWHSFGLIFYFILF